MTAVSIAGIALTSARGVDLDENVAQLRAERHDHGTCVIPSVDGPCKIPYFMLADDGDVDPAALLQRVCRAALADAAIPAVAVRDMSLFIGSSSLHIGEFERDAQAGRVHSDMNELARRIKAAPGITGADYTRNTPCTSSAHALLLAHTLLAAGGCTPAL